MEELAEGGVVLAGTGVEEAGLGVMLAGGVAVADGLAGGGAGAEGGELSGRRDGAGARFHLGDDRAQPVGMEIVGEVVVTGSCAAIKLDR
ncbi:MAG: hypothetical protein AAGG56_17255 [Pseudomonadota bacterium]